MTVPTEHTSACQYHTLTASSSALCTTSIICWPVPGYNSCIPAVSLFSLTAYLSFPGVDRVSDFANWSNTGCHSCPGVGRVGVFANRSIKLLYSGLRGRTSCHAPGLVGSAFRTKTVPVWPAQGPESALLSPDYWYQVGTGPQFLRPRHINLAIFGLQPTMHLPTSGRRPLQHFWSSHFWSNLTTSVGSPTAAQERKS